MNCFFCGAKISELEFKRQRRRSRTSQCSRWLLFFKCNNCYKYFDYRHLQKHKELFNDTLILIGK